LLAGEHAMSNTILLPFQPDSMTRAQLPGGLLSGPVLKGTKPATMPLTVPVLRVLEACRGERTEGPLVLRPVSGKPIDRRDCYRMVLRIAKAAGIARHISPHSLRHAAITNALDAGG
jgi:integrase